MAMASSAKKLCLLFLLITLSSSSLQFTHARDSQFFNKVPSTTTTNQSPSDFTNEQQQHQQQRQEPTFLPDNENGYGLYGHESGQLPPSATTTTTTTTGESTRPLSKYLPKNYNPVAYVTEPENINDGDTTTFSDDKTFSTTTNPYKNNYYNHAGRSYETDQYNTFSSSSNYYTGGGSSFNSQPDTRFNGGATLSSRETSFNSGAGEPNGFRPQGMSDTRSLENGKYFYDINTERYGTNHPYESLNANARSRDVFGNSEINSYEFDNGNSINQDEFQNFNLP